MTNNTVKIDFAKVNAAGDDIISEGKKMFDALKNIQTIINNGKKSFDSEGGDAIRKSFNESAAKFDDFKKFISDYGKFLKEYNEAQRKLNAEIESIAKDIPVL